MARRVGPWLIPLAVLVILVIGAVAYRQQDTERQTAVARANLAETQLALAQASLTAVLHAEAVASATAAAQADLPQQTLRRALDLVFLAYQQPTQAHLQTLNDVFGSAALAIERPEAEHLVSAGTHLGGSSAYTMDVLSTTNNGPDSVSIKTSEQWTYDERDSTDRRVRCVVEQSDQTYTLQRTALAWMVTDIQLGSTHRTDCPAQ